MTQELQDFQALDAILSRLCEQDPDPHVRQELNQLLDNNPHAQRRYLEHQLLHAELLDPSGPLGQMRQSEVTSKSAAGDQGSERDWLLQADTLQTRHINKDTITARQYAALAVYLLGHALTSKLAYKAYLIAAVVVLAATLMFVLIDGDVSEVDPLAEQWPTPGATSDPPGVSANIVATLTETHAAQWAHAPLLPGDVLAAKQRLTLTHGSATITTAKGAVAIIYAPARIQVVGDNALQLFSGRLSGRVDSPQAEGFAIHLPNRDRIVDLGTAFSIDVDEQGRAEVRVTEGLVMWTSADDPSHATDRKPLLIAAGESAALAEGRPVLSRVVRLLGVDFQHTGVPVFGPGTPTAGTTQPGFEAFDQTRVADGNSATFATDAGEITLTLAGLDQDQHNGYFTRLQAPAEDPFPGFDLYNDFVFENSDGRFTLTLTGSAISASQAYDLTFYAYDPGDGSASSRHGRTQAVAFAGIEGTAGQAGPITYTVGSQPVSVDQFKTTATFTADAQGRITIEATDAYEDNEHRIRLNAIEIARRVETDRKASN